MKAGTLSGAIAVVLGAIFTTGHAQESEVIPRSQAVEVAEGSERLDHDFLAGDPSGAVLIHHIDGRQAENLELKPFSWLVLIEGQEVPVGLVAIDAFTGEFSQEIRVEPDYQLPALNGEAVRQAMEENETDPEAYALSAARLFWLGGKVRGNFWIIPHVEGGLKEGLGLTAFDRDFDLPFEPVFSVGERRVYRFEDLLSEQQKSDWVLLDEEFEAKEPVVLRSGDEEARAQALGPMASSSQVDDVSIKDDVPYYDQGSTQWCVLFASAMLHQWWSPQALGSGRQQASNIASFLNNKPTSQGTTAAETRRVLNNWDNVGSFQDFETTWSGVGDHPIQGGSFTGMSDDIKTWITGLDTPVIAFTDSDGGGSDDWADHAVLVTGYKDSDSKIYINNSGAWLGSAGGPEATVSYSDWNGKYWSAIWDRIRRVFKKDIIKRYFIASGYPGDLDRVGFATTSATIDSKIKDGERQHIRDLGLEIKNDAAQGGTDAFGDSYQTSVSIDATGWFENPNSGDFDSTTSASRFQFEHFSGLATGGSLGGGEVFIDPMRPSQSGTGLNDEKLTLTYQVFDSDDRAHSSSRSVTVSDDRGAGINNTLSMPYPALYRARKQVTKTYIVEDDDPGGPLITDFSPINDIVDNNWPSGPIRLKARVVDVSGIREASFSYKVFDRDGNRVSSGSSQASKGSGDQYYYDLPKSEWFNQGKIEWSVSATDDDRDRPGDAQSFDSPTMSFYLPDDDKQGPSIVAHQDNARLITQQGQEEVKVTLEFQLSDPSGVLDNGSYPKVHYRWDQGFAPNSGNQDASVNVDLNGSWYTFEQTFPRKYADRTLYWRIEASDRDDDRPSDRQIAWSNEFRVSTPSIPPELKVMPSPIDFTFGTQSSSFQGSRSFTVENAGGELLNWKAEVTNGQSWIGFSDQHTTTGPETSIVRALNPGNSHQIDLKINTSGLSTGQHTGSIEVTASNQNATGSPVQGQITVTISGMEVTSPQKGSIWNRDASHTIQWTSPNLSGGNVKIEYRDFDNKNPWQTIVGSTPNDGSYSWSIPSSFPSGKYFVSVTSLADASVSDKSESFVIGNAAPAQPQNQSPAHGATGVIARPTLSSSSFSDPNSGDTHQASQWQLRSDFRHTRHYINTRWDSGTDTGNKASIKLPAGVLGGGQVPATRTITVEGTEFRYNKANLEVFRGQQITIKFKNVGGSDHSLRIPNFEAGTGPVTAGNTASFTFTPNELGSFPFYSSVGSDRANGMEGRIKVKESLFWWRVRHQDNHGEWSKWAKETKFSIIESGGRLINLADSQLEQAILSALNMAQGPLAPSDLANLTELRAEGDGIEDLSGLQHAVNLQVLILSGNRIQDLSPLAEVTELSELDVSGNEIRDLTPLMQLTGLNKLDVRNNFLDLSASSDDYEVVQHLETEEVAVESEPQLETERLVRVRDVDVPISGEDGQTVAVPIELVAQGNEAALGLTLELDPSVFKNPELEQGADAPNGTTVIPNTSQASDGLVGVSYALPTGESFNEGTHEILVLNLTVREGVSETTSPVRFSDAVTQREISDPEANALEAAYRDGAVTLRLNTPPTVSSLSDQVVLSGRPLERIVNVSDADSSADTIAVEASVDDRSLIDSVDITGTGSERTLRIETVDNAQGTVTVTVTATDPAGASSTESFELSATQRQIFVEGVRGLVGSQVTVPVAVEAQGNENAFGLSFEVDPEVFVEPQLALGTDAESAGANLIQNLDQAGQGVLGASVSLPSEESFDAGEQRILELTLTIAPDASPGKSTIAFGDTPVTREVADAGANVLPAVYERDEVAIARGLEGDVAPRPTGDQQLTIRDWVQLGRFAAGLDELESPSESKRADIAPRGPEGDRKGGDGRLTIRDWVQGGRFVAGLDPQVPAGGPPAGPFSQASAFKVLSLDRDAGEFSLGSSEAASSPESTSTVVRALDQAVRVGDNVAIPLILKSGGDLVGLSASLRFRPAALRFQELNHNPELSNAQLLVNDKVAESGRVGVMLAAEPGESLPQGEIRIGTALFSTHQNTSPQRAEVTFNQEPIRLAMANFGAERELARYDGATVVLFGSQPQMTVPSVSEDRIALSVIGRPGDQVVLERSTDLESWQRINVYEMPAGGVLRLQERPSDDGRRFYRLISEDR